MQIFYHQQAINNLYHKKNGSKQQIIFILWWEGCIFCTKKEKWKQATIEKMEASNKLLMCHSQYLLLLHVVATVVLSSFYIAS